MYSFLRADEEKFIHYERDDWYVINQIPEGAPVVEPLATFSDERIRELLKTFTNVVRGYENNLWFTLKDYFSIQSL